MKYFKLYTLFLSMQLLKPLFTVTINKRKENISKSHVY